MADYFSKTDLENALSTHVVVLAYDDDKNGVADPGPVAACIAYGGAQCDSFMRNAMMNSSGSSSITLPLTDVPNEVKFAALDFGIAYTIRRRPDVFAAMSLPSWTEYFDKAVEQMKRYAASMQQMPATVGEHATAGASVLNPESDDDGEEECLPDEPRWADGGDFI